MTKIIIKTLFLTIFLLCNFNSSSQRLVTKLYGNLISHDWEEGTSFFGYHSAGLEWKTKKGRIHEFHIEGLSFLQYDKITEINRIDEPYTLPGSIETLDYSISLRYKYNIYTIFESNNFSSRLFLSGKYFYTLKKAHPFYNTTFPTKISQTGIILGFVPSLQYKIKDLIFLSLEIPVDVFNTNLKKKHTYNPALPVDLRTSSTIDAGLYNKKINLIFGIGFKIYEKRKKHYKDVLFM